MRYSQVGETKQLPSAIKNINEGMVILQTGEYAILHLQFRVGDGERILMNWQAMGCLETLRIPYALWDGTTDPSTFLSSLPLAQFPGLIAASTTDSPVRSLGARFDQCAVTEYYADYIEQGKIAYLRSHFGDARADFALYANEVMEARHRTQLQAVVQSGMLGRLVDHIRAMGLDGHADAVASFGQ